MSKEKQIEEMAKIFCGMKNSCDECMWNKVHCNERNYAEEIYNAGYRKQKEDNAEVVRCKDCEHFYQDGNIKLCRHWNCHSTEDDAYCSYAKMKGGAE